MTIYVDPIAEGHVNNGGQNEQYGLDGDDTLFPLSLTRHIFSSVVAETTVSSGENFEDYLEGGSGNDGIFGVSASDRLYGGDGEDLVQGDDGRDRLFGGVGADTFRYFGTLDSLPGKSTRDDIRDVAWQERCVDRLPRR
jgi:Ca2+-binding RTX toxin-like protein